MELKFYTMVNEWIFEPYWLKNTMHYNEEDLFYERTLKYQHHVENYWKSLLHDVNIIWATIEQESSYWCNTTQWNRILKDAEQKLLRLLLKEAEQNLHEYRYNIY